MRSLIWITTLAMLCVVAVAQTSVRNAEAGSAHDPVGADAFGVMQEFFEYDRDIPLEAHIAARQEGPGYVREKIVLRGARDGRAPGYLAIPTVGEAPHPCVILIHGIGGSKGDWWNKEGFHGGGALTESLLAEGIAVLALDAQHHGERSGNNDFESPEVYVFQRGWLIRARDMIVDSVIDLRRAIDYLETRSEIDGSRIGVLGYSMGGMMAMQLSAVDERIAACATCVSPILKDGPSALDVRNFAPYIEQTPFLMMIGEQDHQNYAPVDAEMVLELVPFDDRRLISFESGHRLPEGWTVQAKVWFVERLR